MTKVKKRRKQQEIGPKPLSKSAYSDNSLFRWSLTDCHFDEELGRWNEMDVSSFISDVVCKLQHYSTQTWQDVKSASGGKSEGNGTNNHFISILELDKKRKAYMFDRYQDSQTKDCKYDQVFSLRLTGKQRLVGYVFSHVFYALWYDPEHKIFASNKKHS